MSPLTAEQQCEWHKHAGEGRRVGPEDDPHEACQNCGRLLDTKDCKGCGLT